ncbi:MAG: hypothetical protein KBS70_08060 [Bacteroidales bacterium]|nr:hypothetical protein [Candidatus Colicola equi]
MQKFFSLVCATLLVFSVSAAPVAQKAQLVKKAPVAVEQMQKVQLEKAQIANFNQLSAAPALKVNNQKAQTQEVRSSQMLKKAQAPTRRQAPITRKAPNAPLNTNITIGTFSPATYEGEYYVTLTDANSSTQFYFDFDTSVNPFELGKTYTLNDMIKDYVALGDKNDWYVWEPATAATYTETKDAKGLTHIVASMTTESGTYDLTYDQPEPQSKTIVASDFSMVDYETDMFFILTDSVGNQFRFDVLYTGSFEFGKTYTLADMDPDYSWYKLATGGGLTYTEASFTITEDQDGLLHVVAAVVLNNGDSYEITYDEKAFVPTGVQITVDGTDLNGRYMSAYGFYLYTAKWGDYTVQLPFNVTEEKTTYTNDDFVADYGLIYSDSEQIQLLKLASDNITITNTETTKTLAGSVYAKNGDEYILNLVYEKPDAKEITLVADTLNFFTKMLNAGYYQMQGYTADSTYEFSFYFISKSITGNFTEEDMDAYSTWVDQKDGKKTVVSYQNLSAANVTVSLVKDTLYYTGTMTLATNDGQEAIFTLNLSCPFTQEWGEWADFAPFDVNTGQYTLNAVFGGAVVTKVPVKERKDNTGLKQYQFLNLGKGYYGTDGINMTINMNANRICTIQPIAATVQTQSGPMNIILTDAYTLTHAADYAEASYYDPENGIFNLFVVAIDAQGTLLTAANETMVMDRPGVLDYDTYAPFNAEFAYSDMKASISNGVISISVNNGEKTIGLELYADPAATTIPEGTYTISDSKEASTALQSVGLNGNSLTKCYAGTLDEDGYVGDCWFLVEGTITLSYDEYGKLKVVVDGKNSYGQPVTALVQYEKLEPKSVVTIEADNLTFNGAGTAFVLDAANADYEVVLAVMSTDTAGTYGVNDLIASYSGIYSAAGQVSILDGEFTLAVDGKNMTLAGSLLASDTIQYNLNITGYMGALRLDQDEDVTMSFNLEDATMSGRSGVTSISIQNANQEVVALQVVAQLAGEKLPEGEYLINDTKESNTVIASTGVDLTTGKVSPSYVGLFEGTSLGKVWFLRSGKMTVDAKGNMTINAKNSLDRDVVVTIVVSPTDLININAAVKATKVVRNGRMMVIKDAKVYSVLGQQIQ